MKVKMRLSTKKILLSGLLMLAVTSVFAQFGRRGGNQTITYDELYDDPYDLNKIWVGLIPMYGEVFFTNPTAGFGAEIFYLLNNKAHFSGQVRMPYFRNTDLVRMAGEQSNNFDPNIYTLKNYFYTEVGGTYHIWDKESDVVGVIPLYSKNYKGNKWSSKVAQKADIPNKRREILGVRLGGVFYESAVVASRTALKQNRSLLAVNDVPDLGIVAGDTLDLSSLGRTEMYSNVQSFGFYTGVSYTWIKNFAAKPDKTYSELVEDHIFTTFLDIFVFPWSSVDDVYHFPSPNMPVLYDGSAIRTSMFGARLGIDGKFNRELGWSYGSEIGFRPGVSGFGLYGLLRITFPMYSTKLENKVEAFGR